MARLTAFSRGFRAFEYKKIAESAEEKKSISFRQARNGEGSGMSFKDAFLQAIIENPSDDAPRLIYADWLEEHGEYARAEFIRVQCELARLPEDDEVRRPVIQEREWSLLSAHAKEWLAELPVLEGIR